MTKLHFIMGCTACGKSAVGLDLARRLGGQIVVVDSMKIYRRMDIGTAKPSAAAQEEVPHHCIDIVEPKDDDDNKSGPYVQSTQKNEEQAPAQQ